MAKYEEVKKYIKIRKAAEHNLKDIDVDACEIILSLIEGHFIVSDKIIMPSIIL